MKTCQIKEIDPLLSVEIARTIRPDNISVRNRGPEFEASIVNRKCWQPGQTITIGFLNGSESDRTFIRKIGDEWTKIANLKFDWISDGSGMVRIKRGEDGSWSYMGTDCLGVRNGPTMEFGWLDRGTVLHEFGHMLGLNHSHNSLNFPYHFREDVVIKELSGPPNSWNLNTIRSNVLDKTREGVTETPWAPDNVMNYFCPAHWIVENVAIEPGDNVGIGERELIERIYPGSSDNEDKKIAVGEQISAHGNQEYVFESGKGLYMIRRSPANVRVRVNGRLGSMFSLKAGEQRLNVESRGAFNLVIRRY